MMPGTAHTTALAATTLIALAYALRDTSVVRADPRLPVAGSGLAGLAGLALLLITQSLEQW